MTERMIHHERRSDRMKRTLLVSGILLALIGCEGADLRCPSAMLPPDGGYGDADHATSALAMAGEEATRAALTTDGLYQTGGASSQRTGVTKAESTYPFSCDGWS